MTTRALVRLRQQIRDRGLPLVRGLIAPCSRATLYRLLSGDRKPKLALAARIEQHLGIHAVDWFVEVEEFQKSPIGGTRRAIGSA